jgi:ADP-heptose:LPS heptosyltransferase
MKGFLDDYDTIVLVGFSGEVEKGIREHRRGQTYRVTPRPLPGEETHVAIHVMEQMRAKGLLKNNRDLFFNGCPPLGGESGAAIGHKPASWMTNERSPRWRLEWPVGSQTESAPSRKLILIHPGAGSKRKRWPLESFLAVAFAIRERGSAEVAFLIGPAETDLLSPLMNQARGRFSVHQVERLSQVMALMKISRCFVGNDSGLTHLAAFTGVPTVAIFGPSSSKRWWPVGARAKVLRGDAADCVPCFEMEEANCENPRCLNGVSVERVVEAMGHGRGN